MSRARASANAHMRQHPLRACVIMTCSNRGTYTKVSDRVSRLRCLEVLKYAANLVITCTCTDSTDKVNKKCIHSRSQGAAVYTMAVSFQKDVDDVQHSLRFGDTVLLFVKETGALVFSQLSR